MHDKQKWRFFRDIFHLKKRNSLVATVIVYLQLLILTFYAGNPIVITLPEVGVVQMRRA